MRNTAIVMLHGSCITVASMLLAVAVAQRTTIAQDRPTPPATDARAAAVGVGSDRIAHFPGHTMASIWDMELSPDGRMAVTAGDDRTARVWDLDSGREIQCFEGHARTLEGDQDQVISATFTSDGRQVISGGSDRVLRLWDVATGREVRTFVGHTSPVERVRCTEDGKHVLSCSLVHYHNSNLG